MIALTLFLHHKETFGDKYSVDAKVDPDGDVILNFTHGYADSYRSENASVYLNITQAIALRDKLTELLLPAQPEVLAQALRVAEPALKGGE